MVHDIQAAGKRDDQREVSQEKRFLLALLMGFVGSLTIATERFGLFYWGRVEGKNAILTGYIIALAACYGLYIYFRPIKELVKKHLELLIPFSTIYSIGLALPFCLDSLVSNKAVAVVVLIVTPIVILLFGRRFHSKVQHLSKG